MTAEVLLNVLQELGAEEFENFKWRLKNPGPGEDRKPIPESKTESANRHATVDLLRKTYTDDRALKLTRVILEKIDRNDLVERLPSISSGKGDPNNTGNTSESRGPSSSSQSEGNPNNTGNTSDNRGPSSSSQSEEDPIDTGKTWKNRGPSSSSQSEGSHSADCQRKLKSNLKEKFQIMFEGIAKVGNPIPLNQIYTELYITEGGTAQVNDEHEVRQIELMSRKHSRPETTIRQEDIFKVRPGREKPVRRVMTKGVAGIGKTVLTRMFTLDWAEDKANQDIHFIFPFTFRELNALKEKKFSLVQLVHHFFTETKEAGISSFEDFQVVFIFDGLDECRLPLDFHNTEILTDVNEFTSVGVLLTNLIRGKLLPSARLWITTRPSAANQIPPGCVDMMTEVRGFTDSQKEEYFRKRFRDGEQANRVISHIKTSQSIHIVCQIPVFCEITATVLEDVLKNGEGGALPKTLTEIYIHLLRGAETGPHWTLESREMIESLGKLALEQLHKGKLIFYESDLTKYGITIRAASKFSRIFTEKEERGLFCFIPMGVQEFLAALHVHLTFINSAVNLMSEEQATSQKTGARNNDSAETFIYQSAVDEALKSPNGQLDLFLRFLLGLSLERNQNFIQGLLTRGSSPQTHGQTVDYIKMKLNENLSSERSINLFHCLNELRDLCLVEEVKHYLRSGLLSKVSLSPAQWSALLFILLSSEEDLNVFDLKKYCASEEALLRLLPVVKASNKALLNDCNLSEESCEALSSVLCSRSSSLREVDLSKNNLQELGVMLLSPGLENPYCKLETLRLRDCKLSGRSCEALSSGLSCKSSSLRELDLSNNNLQDPGVKKLSTGLRSEHCKLKILRLSGCEITEGGFAALALALTSNPSHLRELDLSYNHPGDSGVNLLIAFIDNPHCTLDCLRLEPGGTRWLRPGVKMYSCELMINMNTISTKIKLSDNNRKVIYETEGQPSPSQPGGCKMINQPYPDHPDRFECPQLLCCPNLTDQSYWEVEWGGHVFISVSYKDIRRRDGWGECVFGMNDQSWSLECSQYGFSAWHDGKETSISLCASSRVAVYLNRPAGTLAFYSVSTGSFIHLHTFNATFTKPLYAGIGLRLSQSQIRFSTSVSSVSLCSL